MFAHSRTLVMDAAHVCLQEVRANTRVPSFTFSKHSMCLCSMLLMGCIEKGKRRYSRDKTSPPPELQLILSRRLLALPLMFLIGQEHKEARGLAIL